MSSEDGDDTENYPDGKQNRKCFSIYISIHSGEGQMEGQEEELDAMMGELTTDELKAAFRFYLFEKFHFYKLLDLKYIPESLMTLVMDL